jgi:hypothetical protein
LGLHSLPEERSKWLRGILVLSSIATCQRRRGVSSGLDEALKLVEYLGSYAVAQQVQQIIQYYPSPARDQRHSLDRNMPVG